MKFLDPYRWLIGGLLIAGAVAAFGWYRYGLIQKGHAEAIAEVNKQALKQIEQAQEQTKDWMGIANVVDAKNQELESRLKAISRGNSSSAGRLRDSAPSSEQLAGASVETLRANASEAEHDLGECAVRYSDLGDTAAQAAGKAWEFHDKWPAYKDFNDRLTTFTNQLKGNTP